MNEGTETRRIKEKPDGLEFCVSVVPVPQAHSCLLVSQMSHYPLL